VILEVDLGQVRELLVGEVIYRPKEPAVTRLRRQLLEAAPQQILVVGTDRTEDDVETIVEHRVVLGQDRA
jgi:hypothetical protein